MIDVLRRDPAPRGPAQAAEHRMVEPVEVQRLARELLDQRWKRTRSALKSYLPVASSSGSVFALPLGIGR